MLINEHSVQHESIVIVRQSTPERLPAEPSGEAAAAPTTFNNNTICIRIFHKPVRTPTNDGAIAGAACQSSAGCSAQSNNQQTS